MEQFTQKSLGNAVQLASDDDRTESDRLFRLTIGSARPFAPYIS